ncbi:MAG: DUF4328 domain-containing protein [Acidobacteriota bacterium]|nr:DUF4328 domain-containing protein [Acidobacteriota bacterium]
MSGTFSVADAHAGGLTSPEPFRSGHARAQAVVSLFVVYILANLAALVSSLLQLSMLSDVAAGVRYTRSQLQSNDLRQAAITVLCLIVYVALAAVFLLWVHRAYRNLRALGNPERLLNHSPGWAVGSFFIPLVNLYLPYKIVREIWDLSDPNVRTQDDLMFSQPGGSPLLVVWWLSWIAVNIVGSIIFQLGLGARSLDTLLWMTKGLIIMRALNVVAAVLALLVVRQIDRRQEERSRHVSYAPELPPPPPVFNQPTAEGPPTSPVEEPQP